MQSGNSRLNDDYFLAKWCYGRFWGGLCVVGKVVRLWNGFDIALCLAASSCSKQASGTLAASQSKTSGTYANKILHFFQGFTD